MDHIKNATRMGLLAITLLFGMMSATTSVFAQLDVYRARAYTDNIDPSSPSFDPALTGHRLHLEATVDEIPSSIEQVRAIGLSPNAPPSYDLPIFSQGEKWVGLPEYTGVTGRWGIEATMFGPPAGTGETGTDVTHVLDKPALIPLANNIQFSDQSVAPTISWDPVLFTDHTGAEREVDFYKINIERDGSFERIYDSSLIDVPSFAVPTEFLTVGDSVWFRITARHYDPQPSEGLFGPTSGFWIENQSRTWVSFTPLTDAIPTYSWNVDGGGDWHAAANWMPDDGPPNRAHVVLGDAITAPAVITTNDINAVTNSIEFNNSNSYMIQGSAAVVLGSRNNVVPEVRVVTGSHEIQVPILFEVGSEMHVAADSALVLQDSLSANDSSWSKFGEGVLVVNGDATATGGTLSLWEGTLTGTGTLWGVQQIGGTLRPGVPTEGLTIVEFYRPFASATLELEIRDATAGVDSDQLEVGGGFLDGKLDLRRADGFEPQYGEQFDLVSADDPFINGSFGTIDGVSISADKSFAVDYAGPVVRAVVALPGDANLDGTVDGSDFNIWNTYRAFPTRRSTWTSADFNGDGVTDGQDFGIWNAHRFMAVSGAVSAVLPEPSSMSLVIAGAFLMFWVTRHSEWRSTHSD